MDLFNKKKVLELKERISAFQTSVVSMRRKITILEEENKKLKEENSNLKFTLKHQRTY